MLTVTAYYDGISFVPTQTINIPRDTSVKLTITEENALSSEIAKKIAALKQLEREIDEEERLNPTPPEFDEILAKRVRFSHDEKDIEL